MTLIGCGASVPEVEHRAALNEQQARYERELKRLDDDRKRNAADCERDKEELARLLARQGDQVRAFEGSLSDKQRLLDQQSSPGGRAATSKEHRDLGAFGQKLRQAFSAEIAAKKAEVLEQQSELVLRVAADVLFARGSAVIAAEAEPLIDKLGAALSARQGIRAEIAVHTDAIAPAAGSPLEDTWAIATHQALALVRAHTAKGIDPSRLSVAAFGQHKPLASNETPEGRAKNRRVEWVFSAL